MQNAWKMRGLENAGLSREQAELQTEIVIEAVRETMQHYSTNAEMTHFKSDMKTDFKSLENKMNLDFQSLENKMNLDFQSLENKMQKEIAPIRTQMAVMMWTQGLIVLTVVVPAIKQILGL